MSASRHVNTYMWAVIAAGAAALAYSVLRLPISLIGLPYLLLALAAVVVISGFTVRIPYVSGRITVADTFVFLALLLYGGGPAVLIATADGFCSSLRISRRPRTILFNSAVMACSTLVTGWTLKLMFGPVTEIASAGLTANFLGALCVMGLTQYVCNSGLVAVEKSFKTGRTPWATWREFYLWTSVTYIAGASAAGLIAGLVGAFGFVAAILSLPVVAIIYLTYRTYLQNIEASQAHAREAERHVEELNHYIAEIERAEEERDRLLVREQQARAEAEEASRLKDEFLATLSHELRTPLASILGWANLLREGGLDDETARQALGTIERSAENQKRLIDDLLDVSRIITGKLRLDVREVALAHVIGDAVEVVRPAADANGIGVSVRMDPEVGPVMGDTGRLRQVVWNLLFNAVKFTPRGGRVEVRLERDGSHAKVSISDTGKGIAPEFLPHVFDRFRQADGATTRRHGGLGLGLSIVRHLVELHGGEVRAESEGPGRGATFSITLPLLAVRFEPQGRGAAGEAGRPQWQRVPRHALRGVRVLVVDDDPDAREMIRAVLSMSGAEVRPSGSADEAIATLGLWRPDVLLSDIGMPGTDGYGLIRLVRSLAEEQGGRIPAAALTAYARDGDRERALAAGFQLHVAKPVSSSDLVAAVAGLARQRA